MNYLVKLFKICVVDMFKNQSRCSGHRVFHNALQCDDVGAAPEVLQDLDLTFDLLLLDGLQDLDDAAGAVRSVHPLEDLTVLPTPNLADHLRIARHNHEP